MLSFVVSVTSGTAQMVATAAKVPLRIGSRLERALADLASVARGVDSMNGEFVGMRDDIAVLDDHVVGLRDGIEGVRSELSVLRNEIVDPIADVTPMRAGVHRLEAQVEILGERLESVDSLALRFSRFGRARVRARDLAPDGNGSSPAADEDAEAPPNGDRAADGRPARD
jgi:hypothetical protein